MHLEVESRSKTRAVERVQTRVNRFLKIIMEQENVGDFAILKFDSSLSDPFQLVWNWRQLVVEVGVCPLVEKQFDKRVTLDAPECPRKLVQVPSRFHAL